MNNYFKTVDENGIERTAEIITPFSYNGKDYILYSIDRDKENTNVFVSYLVKDAEGYDTLKDIDDENERETVKRLVKELLEENESSN